MKILFAGIIARYPFGGVTWCSLMYLLGLRALGHEVFYIEDTGECVYDPVQNTRATDPATGRPTFTPRSSPSGSATGGRSSTTTAPTTAAAPTTSDRSAPTPICSSISRADRGSGATSTRASRARSFIDSDPAFTQLAIAKARAVVRRVLPALRSPVHLRRQHRHGRLAGPDGRVHVAQDLAAGHARRLGDTDRAPRDRFTTRDDVADRELHRRRRQQGSGVPQVHRSAVAHRRSRSSSPSTARSSCCASTAGRPSTRWACRARRGTTATSSTARRPSSASPSTPTSRRVRAGSAIAPSATWRPAARRSCRTPAGRRICRHGEGLLAFSTSRGGAGRHRPHQRRLRTATRGARVEIAREHFDARRACSRRLAARRPAHELSAAAAIAHVAPGRDDRFRRPSPAPSRR